METTIIGFIAANMSMLSSVQCTSSVVQGSNPFSRRCRWLACSPPVTVLRQTQEGDDDCCKQAYVVAIMFDPDGIK